MKEIDDTDPPESESEDLNALIVDAIKHLGDESKAAFQDRDAIIRGLMARVTKLECDVADLHHRRRVSRHQTVNQDPEWFS